MRYGTLTLSMLFQSTLSMRRATHFHAKVYFACNISIHALHEESDLNDTLSSQKMRISIHALHEESDR